MATSVTIRNTTWTFSADKQVGTFANGDPWVVGPVSIIAISPGPVTVTTAYGDRNKNGSMLNPVVEAVQGYDTMLQGVYWQADWNYNIAKDASRPGGSALSSGNPLTINSGSLISATSYDDLPAGSGGGCRVQYMEILTVLSSAPASGSFRPAYCGTDKTIPATSAQLRNSLLPTYAVPTSPPDLATIVSGFTRPWVDHLPGWLGKEQSLPTGNMPNYGREVSQAVAQAAEMLLLNCDANLKLTLVKAIVQLGIDNYGCTVATGGLENWKADGGHMPGRGFPILFAGMMLNNSAMLGVMSKSGVYAYNGGDYPPTHPSDYLHFGEQDQCFYVTQHEVDYTHSGSWAPDSRVVSYPYNVSDIGNPSWGISHVVHPEWDNNYINANYRSVNQPSWVGWIVASLVLRLKPFWNNNALFDAQTQWMTDPAAETAHSRTTWDQAMYDTYKTSQIADWTTSSTKLVMVLK
jgi:hypothetical protein